MDEIWDCVVVGGGAAGLSAALVLGRARRRTLLIDAGRPSNLPAHGIGGLLGHDHQPPAELYRIGRTEVLAYSSVRIRTCEVVGGERIAAHFVLELADGTREMTRRVLLATGMDYERPDLPGLEELWGGSVFHCPFCHGWEMRDRPLAVLDPSEAGPQRALLLRGWSDDVVLLTDGPAQLPVRDRERLAAARIPVDERRLERLIARDRQLEAIAFAGGGRLARAGLLLGVRLRQRSPLAGRLGVRAGDPTPVALDPIAVDPLQRTGVPGVFAAGDATGTAPSVAAAIATGSLAATSVVHSLVEDDGPGD